MEQEYAVFVLVRVHAESPEKASEAVSIVLSNAIQDDMNGLKPVGVVVDYEFQDVITG